MCHKESLCKGMLAGVVVGMIGGVAACYWCHTHKRLLRRQVNVNARKDGHLIESVNELF